MFPKAERVAVVGSGPSLRDIAPNEIVRCGATVIAVNGAIDWLGSAHYWFTLDPSQVNMVRMRNPVEGCQYVACGPGHIRFPMWVKRLSRITGDQWGKARAPGGLSEDPAAINTGNSGFGALNLAYHMRPKKVALLGVDGRQVRRIDGGMPRTLAHLPELFASAAPQLRAAGVQVANGSPDSEVTCFPRMSPREALQWLLC